tara:strand:- start:969 stop:1202 length:234 start_codon:yes stop_codon:yes gene_type:complete
VYIQRITPQKIKIVKIMSKLIEDRVGRRMFKPIDLFNHMSDDDFMMVHESGQLYNLCMALSVDLQPKSDEKDYTYTA